MVSHNPFSLYEDRGNFNSSPPFGLYDSFNYSIRFHHSTDYNKHGLAAYKSFEDYR